MPTAKLKTLWGEPYAIEPLITDSIVHKKPYNVVLYLLGMLFKQKTAGTI